MKVGVYSDSYLYYYMYEATENSRADLTAEIPDEIATLVLKVQELAEEVEAYVKKLDLQIYERKHSQKPP